MSLRFSKGGPELPDGLIEAFLRGEAILLCGAGISFPQLPNFKKLANDTFTNLDVPETLAEAEAIASGRFEEALGSLGRRLADPSGMTREVTKLLRTPSEPDLTNHLIVLRLSRSFGKIPSLVTTNFDTLLEYASQKFLPDIHPRTASFAGQALPAPGSTDFGGIIHLHGRLADEVIGLEATPLVLTSSDYGDAYMRSGWAARFLFDLARCRTIVLLGYSAGDAPVRYFLNVLEADRTRFSDLKPVYAFDSYRESPLETETRWGTLGVEPLPYQIENSDGGIDSHHTLWHDLEALAEMVERPKKWRQIKTREIICRSLQEVTDVERRTIRWLLADKRDLWPEVIQSVKDVEWFNFLEQEKLWSKEDAASISAIWIAIDFASPERLRHAVEWQQRYGNRFTDELRLRLGQGVGLDELMLRAWRLLWITPVHPVDLDTLSFYSLQQALRGSRIRQSDIEAAVSVLVPKLLLSSQLNYRVGDDTYSGRSVNRLSDLERLSKPCTARRSDS